MSIHDAADALNLAAQRVVKDMAAGGFVEMFVETVTGNAVALTKTPGGEAVQGFTTPPDLLLAHGDRVLAFHSGSTKYIFKVLNRDASTGGAGGEIDLSGLQAVAEKGIAGGYASLDLTGVVPLTQLPALGGSGGNVDGGAPDSVYGGTTGIDGGTP